ncbi:MAG: hypothetical protein KA998_03870, partial [Rickettsiaceae bacterium]|nr:hypothetical protein [Rickettsiaceae bacterium]
MPEDGKTLARLQKQVLENNKARLKKLPTEIANSTSLNDATERLKGLVDQNEIYDKNIFSQCVNNYINLLDRNLGNIDSKEYLQLLRVLKHIKNNNEYDLLEIKEVFANHSKNYAQSVNFQFENRIDDFIIKIYDILLSSTSSTEDLHYSFMSRDILLSKSIYTILKKGLPKDFPLDNSVLMMASQEKFSYQETKYLIEKFRIDITNISKTPHIVTLGNKEVTLLGDITPILLEHANKIWIKNQPEGEKLLSLFIEKGMNLSAKQSYNNAVMIAIERDNLG